MWRNFVFGCVLVFSFFLFVFFYRKIRCDKQSSVDICRVIYHIKIYDIFRRGSKNFSWGGGVDFQKNFENFVDFFLDRPN